MKPQLPQNNFNGTPKHPLTTKDITICNLTGKRTTQPADLGLIYVVYFRQYRHIPIEHKLRLNNPN